MFCSKCGNQLQEDSKFCIACGANIEEPIQKDQEPVTQNNNIEQKPKKKKKWLIPLIGVLAIAVIATGCILAFDLLGGKDKEYVKSAAVTDELINEVSEEDIEEVSEELAASEDENFSLSFSQSEIKVGKEGMLDLTTILINTDINAENLIWESDSPNEISVDADGLVTVNEVGASAGISVFYSENNTIFASCQLTSFTEGDYFAEQLMSLNSVNAELESIDVFADNYLPSVRNTEFEWDPSLFYSLEEIDPDKEEDGQINSYDIEKKQLINAESGKLMEYEIYRNPNTNIVNKIVSIEYVGDYLGITDYYYDNNGKVSFIFERQDINYIPSYANPTIDGIRYYFHEDVMVKWRSVKEGKQTNYIIGENEEKRIENDGSVTLYNKLSKNKKKAYDQKEIDMINAAYNTYNIVLVAEGISNIIGYVNDENGNPLGQAKVSLYSVEYGMWAYEITTDQNGLYSIVVPSQEAQYNIKVELEGYVETELFEINMNYQSVGLYQENIQLVYSTGSSYDIQLTLFDALNFATDNSGMLRLENAIINVRQGINNKMGNILLSDQADENGQVSIKLEEGTYTIEMSEAGYETSYNTIVAKESNQNMNINTSPVLADDEVRIVLTWGSYPSDLDSHLFTPYDSSSGDDTYHIWFRHKMDNNNNLDVDDTDSYGPETMTIHNLGNGLYKYYVADYNNCSEGDTNSTDMSLSGARVSVYTKEGLVQSFYVPNNNEGVIWEVFEIRNKRIIPTQRYYNNIDDKSWWNNTK